MWGRTAGFPLLFVPLGFILRGKKRRPALPEKGSTHMSKKTVLITGAASGIGYACAEKMAREGYATVIADINQEAAERAAQTLREAGLEAMAVKMDVSSEAEVEAELVKIIAEVGATQPSDMGKVMGVATKRLAGLAEGRLISTLVKKLLA